VFPKRDCADPDQANDDNDYQSDHEVSPQLVEDDPPYGNHEDAFQDDPE
jgi:hypothetical protein